MVNSQYIAIGVAVIAFAAVYVEAQSNTVPPIRKCYVCSPCSSTEGYAISECQPAHRYCYKEVRSDGSITRSCAVNCSEGTWTLNSVKYSVNCCTDKEGCNSATSFSVSNLGLAVAFLAALAALNALRRH